MQSTWTALAFMLTCHGAVWGTPWMFSAGPIELAPHALSALVLGLVETKRVQRLSSGSCPGACAATGHPTRRLPVLAAAGAAGCLIPFVYKELFSTEDVQRPAGAGCRWLPIFTQAPPPREPKTLPQRGVPDKACRRMAASASGSRPDLTRDH